MNPILPLTLLALAAPAVSAAGDPPLGLSAGSRMLVGQITIHERIIVRVPRLQPQLAVGRTAIPAVVAWKEKKGPKCVAATDLGGAMISKPGTVDLVLTGGDRLRAILDDDCGPLDYYSGFYLRPASDGQICADRDVIRVRSGASCMIEGFRRLVASR